MKTESGRLPACDSNNFILTGRQGRLRIIVWGLLSTLFFTALFALKPTLLQPLDFINYDLLLRNFPNNCASSRLVIADLDEKSLNRYGQWPWPRYRVAELFDKIADMEPSVICVDMIFAEPDRTSAGRLLKDLGEAYKLKLSVDRLPGKLLDNDLILAETLSGRPFVLGNKFHFSSFIKSSEQCVLHPVNVSFMQNAGEKKDDTGIPESSGVLCNLKMLSEKVSASGFVNFSPDQSGMLRRIPLLIQYNGEFYPSLALATVLKLVENGNILLKKDGNILQSVNYRGTSVPVDPHGQLLIKFRNPKIKYDYISAADIMDGSVSSERLRGKIAFVGTSATGLAELRTTPFNPTVPGVEVHATVVDNLLTGDFISVPGWANGLILLLVFILGVSLTLCTGFRSAVFCFIVMILFIAGLWIAAQQIFFRMGLFAGTAFPIASVFCNYIFLTFLKYWSDYRCAQKALKESEARFRTLFKRAPMPMSHISLDGKVLDVNDSLTETMGYTIDDVPTLDHAWKLSFTDPELKNRVASKWQADLKCAAAGNSETEPLECPVLCRDGTMHTMIISSRLLGDSIIISFFDITGRKRAEEEREKLQEQLHQSRKLEAVGILAGGVAHDFNNMLGVIMGYAELAKRDISPEDRFNKNLDRIIDAARRSASLTRQLLAFARKQTIEPVVFELSKSVEAILKMIRRLIGENIELAWLPGDGPCTVRMDPSQFDQILLNLCVNARDAITDVGRITIKTDTVSFDEAYCKSHAESVPGDYVLLSVSDNGSGMDKDTLNHIFEPFFTTKGLGRGTGMGLATVYGIVKQNNGFINVYSEPGKGTTFKICIPLNAAEAVPAGKEHIEDIPRSRGETILIAEDDPTLLEMGMMMLQKLGYSVISAATPNEAIRIAEKNSSEIHLVITDVIMPEMNGRDLVARLQAIRPKMKHLFMSGYTADIIAHHGVLDEGVNFIQKPFSVKDMAAKVREVLG
ncbi:MAG: CHASE2 domain-containing protein [Desulfococcaceae bacterium]